MNVKTKPASANKNPPTLIALAQAKFFADKFNPRDVIGISGVVWAFSESYQEFLEWLAGECGYGVTSLRHVLGGTTPMTAARRERFAKATGASMADVDRACVETLKRRTP